MTDGLTGIIFGAIFGSLFLITCLISAVKAVRDRKRIKTRIAQREREKRSNETPSDKDIADKNKTGTVRKANIHKSADRNGCSNAHLLSGVNLTKISDAVSSSVMDDPIQNGVDNLTFERSLTDIHFAGGGIQENSEQAKSAPKVNTVFQTTCETSTVGFPIRKQSNLHSVGQYGLSESCEDDKQYKTHASSRDKMKKASSSDEKDTRKQIEMRSFSPNCFALKKLLRRHSYEVAISDNSWIPIGQLETYATTFKNGDNYGSSKQSPKKYSLGCENNAYAGDVHKRNSAF